MAKSEGKQPMKPQTEKEAVIRKTWAQIAKKAAIYGGVCGLGYLLRDLFETGALVYIGSILAFGAFILWIWPITWNERLRGFPFFLIGAAILAVIAGAIAR